MTPTRELLLRVAVAAGRARLPGVFVLVPAVFAAPLKLLEAFIRMANLECHASLMQDNHLFNPVTRPCVYDRVSYRMGTVRRTSIRADRLNT